MMKLFNKIKQLYIIVKIMLNYLKVILESESACN